LLTVRRIVTLDVRRGLLLQSPVMYLESPKVEAAIDDSTPRRLTDSRHRPGRLCRFFGLSALSPQFAKIRPSKTTINDFCHLCYSFC
jgi:hypothetical protein